MEVWPEVIRFSNLKGRQQHIDAIDCDTVLYAVHILPLVSRLSLPQSVLRLQTLHGGHYRASPKTVTTCQLHMAEFVYFIVCIQ